jgi:hypothetical protein
MNNKTINILITILVFLGIIIYLITVNNNYSNELKLSKSTVDSLNIQIDSLEIIKVDLMNSLDSSINNVQVIEKWYEKEYTNIMYQPADSDCIFFARYLSENFK